MKLHQTFEVPALQHAISPEPSWTLYAKAKRIVVLATLERGAVIGETAFFLNTPRSATIRTVKICAHKRGRRSGE